MFSFFKQKAIKFRWPLLSGILVGTSYIPFAPWALLFCYAPLWIFATAEARSRREAMIGAWLTQFTLTLIGFYWIAYTAHEFGQIPWVLSILALGLYGALMHLYIPAAVGLGVWLQRRLNLSTTKSLFVIALLHALLERVWPVIFDWHLGYTLLWAQIPLYQLADLVGFAGLSTFILLCNAWIAVAWQQRHQRNLLLRHLAAITFCLTLLTALGQKRQQDWQNFDQQVNATVIQANIGNLEKVYAEQGRGYQEAITRKFITMTQEASQRFPETEIFIWPETAFPDYLDAHFSQNIHSQILAEGLSAIGKPLITGAYSKDLPAPRPLKPPTYNALFLLDLHGNNLDAPYRKTELLAFGEYLPLSERFPIILKLLPFISNFGRGQGPKTMDWKVDGKTIRWGGQICYEGLYPGFTRGLSEKGADILVNLTNDSWFGKSTEPHQHLYMTLARAIEVRRPLIRSTNTGISTAILANGDVQQKSPVHEEWSGTFMIKYLKNAPTTFYVRWGHWDWIVSFIALGVILGTGVIHARSRRS